jgi:VCBS repeat-containing protein
LVGTTTTQNLKFTVPDSAFDVLSAGETITVTYDLTVSNTASAQSSSPTQLVVTIVGSNDAPVITTAVGGNQDDASSVAPNAAGVLTSSDLDAYHTATWSGNQTTAYGTFAINASTGEWTYHLSNNAPISQLNATQTVVEQFTATVTDDQGASAQQVVTVTIHGSNQAPVVTAHISENATEAGAPVVVSALLNVTDVSGELSKALSRIVVKASSRVSDVICEWLKANIITVVTEESKVRGPVQLDPFWATPLLTM